MARLKTTHDRCFISSGPVPVAAARVGQRDCRDDLERRFLERLNERAERGGWSADSWSHTTDHVVIAISLVKDGAVYRDLRADLFGNRLLLGYDQSHQFVTELDPTDPSVIQIALETPEAMAEAAADWFEGKLRPGEGAD